MNRRPNASLSDSKTLSLQTKLELYSETISVLQASNERLVKENLELKQQLDLANTGTQSFLHSHKSSTSLNQGKSGLLEIIENFQSQSVELSNLESLQQEFEDVEVLQSSIKQENQGLKERIRKFENLSPVVQKISNLSQKIFFAVQTVLNGEELNSRAFLHNDKNLKKIEKPEFFIENLNRSKELLEKIFESILDFSAEKTGSEECKTV